MATRYIKEGALAPALTATLTDENGTAVDVSAATAKTVSIVHINGTVIQDGATVDWVTDGTNGQVSYTWQSGDTDTTGELRVEFDITIGGAVIKFPDNGYGTVIVVGELP